jgi:galactose-1-phosphate uridylyltransferase
MKINPECFKWVLSIVYNYPEYFIQYKSFNFNKEGGKNK